ncbi:MAG TPA: hypothetical protein VHZ02_09840, partial [Acidimicrobiales bacterium]|nr:hypothetical protein [Acidimicrobiales bacterium]
MLAETLIREVTVAAYEIPTDQPEGDGTLAWSSTVLVVVRVRAGESEGLGWTYAGAAATSVVAGKLAGAVTGLNALDLPAANEAMLRTCRNLGQPGIA